VTTDTKLFGLINETNGDEMPFGLTVDHRKLVGLLARKWKLLLLISIAGGVVGLVVALAIPNLYTATAVILPPTKPQSASAALMGQLGGAAGALAPTLGLKDPNEMYIGIMRSRTTSDDLIDGFGLLSIYSSKTRESARRKLLTRANILSGRDSMIRISVEDRDPQRAANLANAYVAELKKQNNRLALTEAGQRRLFFEHEVEAEKNALANAEDALRDTQERTGVVEVSGQAQAVIGSIAKIRAEIAMEEVSLKRLRMGATAENPEVIRDETELAAMRSELAKLEAGNPKQRSGDPLIPSANVPQARLEYVRALRDTKYHETLFEVLSKQYEAAKIDEAKESPVIQVVDPAIPPETKSFPPRLLIVFLGVVLAGVGGMIFVYVADREALQSPGQQVSLPEAVGV